MCLITTDYEPVVLKIEVQPKRKIQSLSVLPNADGKLGDSDRVTLYL